MVVKTCHSLRPLEVPLRFLQTDSDVIFSVTMGQVGLDVRVKFGDKTRSLCAERTTPIDGTHDNRQNARWRYAVTRSSPQWRSGRSTTIERGVRGWARWIVRPWVSISSPLTDKVYLLPFDVISKIFRLP